MGAETAASEGDCSVSWGDEKSKISDRLEKRSCDKLLQARSTFFTTLMLPKGLIGVGSIEKPSIFQGSAPHCWVAVAVAVESDRDDPEESMMETWWIASSSARSEECGEIG